MNKYASKTAWIQIRLWMQFRRVMWQFERFPRGPRCGKARNFSPFRNDYRALLFRSVIRTTSLLLAFSVAIFHYGIFLLPFPVSGSERVVFVNFNWIVQIYFVCAHICGWLLICLLIKLCKNLAHDLTLLTSSKLSWRFSSPHIREVVWEDPVAQNNYWAGVGWGTLFILVSNIVNKYLILITVCLFVTLSHLNLSTENIKISVFTDEGWADKGYL